MQLTPHFFLAEFCRSQIAARMGRTITPSSAQLSNLLRLCTAILEPLREAVQRPITIDSGLRPPWLNLLVGGAASSAHLTGCAADILVTGMSPLEVCSAIQRLGLPIDQCIYEFPPNGWTHVAVAELAVPPRGQYLTALVVDEKTVYRKGLQGQA